LADYTQAMMDFGATLCTRNRPNCNQCPFRGDCAALREGRVALVPTRKPGRALATRAVVMLWLENSAGQIALQRREGPGVWQGLWSLPEAPDHDDAQRWLARHMRFDPNLAQPLPAFVHVFSHYRLDVQPLHIRGVEPLPAVAESGTPRWFKRSELADLGLPAPVRRLLLHSL
jgi:A/G-specific adenine glycosylase